MNFSWLCPLCDNRYSSYGVCAGKSARNHNQKIRKLSKSNDTENWAQLNGLVKNHQEEIDSLNLKNWLPKIKPHFLY